VATALHAALQFGSDLRPAVCAGLQPSHSMCGDSRQQAMIYLLQLEADTLQRKASSS
jgi:hypothetical protein